MSNLALYLTRRLSIKKWHDIGILKRELNFLYLALDLGIFKTVTIYSYGNDEDRDILSSVVSQTYCDAIQVVYWNKRWSLVDKKGWMRSILYPFLFFLNQQKISVFMSNQMDGAWSAMISSKIQRKPFIFKMGYRPYELEQSLRRLPKIVVILLKILERTLLITSSKAVVNSLRIKTELISTHKLSPKASSGIVVVPTIIDTNIFKPREKTLDKTIIYVGRISHEKNLVALSKGCHSAGLKLVMYTNSSAKHIEKFYTQLGRKYIGSVEIKEGYDNNQIAAVLSEAKYFALVSENEGLPKAALEALSSGCLCLLSNIPAHASLAQNNTAAKLTGTSASDIKNSLDFFLKLNSEDETRMMARARRLIEENFSKSSVAKKLIFVFDD